MIFESFHSGSTGNLYRASNDTGSLLIEAGVSVARIKQALNFKLSEVSGCLVSHRHKDHCAGVPGLVNAGIDCYLSAETAKSMNLNGSHRAHIIEPLVQFTAGAWTVLPFPTQHDTPGALGFLISDGKDKLLFATDTFYIHHRFEGLTHIAIECNWSKHTLAPNLDPVIKKRLYRSHFSLENVIKFLKANNLQHVREIWLIHISDGNGDPERFQLAVQKEVGKPVYTHQGGG